MALTIERDNGTLIAKAQGRLDGTNAQEFQGELTDAIAETDRAVVLDLEHLSYISSAGLRVILLTAKALQRQDAELAVCSLSVSIREVFAISGFDKIITVRDSQAEAIAALRG
jgi:anti-anti-sigma factor